MGENVKIQARGTFDVTLAPLAIADSAAASTLGRMSIDKRFHGDLEAASTGEMLTASTAVKDSAAYVAIERVAGTLHGRSGTFVLQHTGVMTRGDGQLTVAVVPDSGTDDLEGLVGTMSITIVGREHSSDFEYAL